MAWERKNKKSSFLLLAFVAEMTIEELKQLFRQKYGNSRREKDTRNVSVNVQLATMTNSNNLN